MSRSYLDPAFLPEEVSARLAFAHNPLDRLSEARSEDCVEEALANPDCRVIGHVAGRILVRFDDEVAAENGDSRGETLVPMADLEPFSPHRDRAVLLGFDNNEGGAPRIAVPLAVRVGDDEPPLPEPWKAIDYRSVVMRRAIPDEDLGMVAQGASLLAWHSSSRFCGRCGSATEMHGGGVKRHCPSCERDHFPRTDPVVIMLIVSGEKCLLGRSPHFPPGMFSALAGFVEPGETIEMAVRRETFEEAGIRVGEVVYHATQPWPFPHTLMIGCYGEALETDIVRDEEELDDCRWFTREEILQALEGNTPLNEDGTPTFFTPPPFAIASRLVKDWAKDRSP